MMLSKRVINLKSGMIFFLLMVVMVMGNGKETFAMADTVMYINYECRCYTLDGVRTCGHKIKKESSNIEEEINQSDTKTLSVTEDGVGGSNAESGYSNVRMIELVSPYEMTGYKKYQWLLTNERTKKNITLNPGYNSDYTYNRLVESLQASDGDYITASVKWIPESITVQFYADQGTCSTKSKTVTYNSAYGSLPTPSRTGYTFEGWQYKDSIINEKTLVKATSNITLTAKWKINNYTVVFDANGGDINTSSKSITYNSTYGSLPTPTRTGYTFSGWKYGSNVITAATKMTTAQNHTLIAQWTANTYKVTFNTQGGVLAQTSKDVTYDSTYGTLPTPAKKGYSFVGWSKNTDGTNMISSTNKVTDASDITVYAIYEANMYKVIFDANGGVCDTASKNYYYDKSYVSFPVASKDGYGFNGWYTKAEGGTKILESNICDLVTTTTFYAHYSPSKYKIIFDANGGKCTINSINVAYDAKVGTLPAATRDGYTFEGWSLDKSGTNLLSAEYVYNKQKDMTVYAVWKKKSNNSSDNSNNGGNSSNNGNSGDKKTTEAAKDTKTQVSGSVPAVSAVKVKNLKGKKIKVTFKKVSGFKYEVQYSTSKKFKKAKKKFSMKNSVTIKKLKKGKKYYVRVRAYTENGKAKTTGKWTVKSVKIKK